MSNRYLKQIVKDVNDGIIDFELVKSLLNCELDKSDIREFINELLISDNIELSLVVLEKSGILYEVFDVFKELKGLKQPSNYHKYDVYNHIMEAVKYSEKDLILRMSMLLHDIGKKKTFQVSEENKITFYGHANEGAKMAYRYLMNLGYDKKFIDEVCLYIRHHMDYAPTEKSFNKMLKEFDNDLNKVDKLLKVKLYDKMACKGKDDMISVHAREIDSEYRTFLNKYIR